MLKDTQELLSFTESATGKQKVYKYGDELDLIRGQFALISLAFHCLTFADNVKYDQKKAYYQLIQAIFARDELQLGNMALDPCTDFVLEEQSCAQSSLELESKLSLRGGNAKNLGD